jgi:serine protease Do
MDVFTMKNKSTLSGAALGVVAAVLAASGGYLAHANAQPVGPARAATAPAAAPLSFADVIERVAPAVVSVDVEGKSGPRPAVFSQDDGDDDEGASPFSFSIPGAPGGGSGDLRRFFQQQPQQRDPTPTRGTGSGFFISADGYIVTNNHVVEGAEKITIRTTDERTLTAKVVGLDEATDLAVLKVEGKGFPYVSFEDRAKPRVGDWVIAVGNPFNLGGTATAGIVSALGRQNVSGSSYVDYLQIDAPINRGNSGGPTFDVNGRVVGVNSAIFSPSGGSVGIGFDIPADVAAAVTKQLIANGKVVRGYIGASIQNVTPEISESLGLKGSKGALVAELTPGAPAAEAGLQPGDLVLKINGRDVESSSDLTRQVGLAQPGEAIRVQVRRGGAVRDFTIRSGTRPDENVLKANLPRDAGSPSAPSLSGPLGLRVSPAKSGGLQIDGVATNSDARVKGLKQGDVILRAGERATNSTEDLKAAVDEAQKAGRKEVLVLVARSGQRTFLTLKIDPQPAAG